VNPSNCAGCDKHNCHRMHDVSLKNEKSTSDETSPWTPVGLLTDHTSDVEG